MKDTKTFKVSDIQKSTGTNATKPASLEVYSDDKKHGAKILVLTCHTEFILILNCMNLDAES